MPYEDIISRIKQYKQEFLLKAPDEISKGSSIGDYNKFILDDKNKFECKITRVDFTAAKRSRNQIRAKSAVSAVP